MYGMYYTFTGGNGFSAILSFEQGNDVDTDPDYPGTIDTYVPHIVGGLRFAQGWGALTAVGAYDTVYSAWAAKLRADINLTDRFSLWVMGGYKNIDDEYMDVSDDNGNVIGQVRAINSFYGTWGGDWAVWGGAAFRAGYKTTINVQAAYDASSVLAATANIAYEAVPGFTITPEVSYTKWSDEHSIMDGRDAWQGMVRFQRSF